MCISLKEITADNWYECTKLSVTEEQKNIFPVPVVYWMAMSKYEYNNQLELFAVYHKDLIVGVVAYGIDPDISAPWITTVMIDQKYQGKGYGREAVKYLVDLIIKRHSCKKIIIGHRPDNHVAAKLYESLGFQKIELKEDEIIRCLQL
ncbi:GNAT family N-acetyltransferase [Lutispora thermophila]|uniref:Diamine N-acetyltransferase n=1 Tax=Lutispora thermophila DSM 19022 TaxID=1122184 RepID=A0A1M6EVS6_9FIRM|nr:GNAT family N-acetyltransferase [Lutispora thermophila]SHI89479.1 diamine N-acetyltransferase [Lutispora thermophila DSM 19022]